MGASHIGLRVLVELVLAGWWFSFYDQKASCLLAVVLTCHSMECSLINLKHELPLLHSVRIGCKAHAHPASYSLGAGREGSFYASKAAVEWGDHSFPFSAKINPLNPELNLICYLLAVLAHHFIHVSRIMVKSLTLRLLMSYIYGAHILDVSRSHTTTQHSR